VIKTLIFIAVIVLGGWAFFKEDDWQNPRKW